jgi:hypothetical protein
MSVDLNGLKTNIKSILDGANTTTGSPIDLSANMTTRIKQILSIDVKKIPIQPSFFPCVTMFFGAKQISLQDISNNLLTGRRRAKIDMSVVGLVWIDNMSSANFELKDLADNECENLMENVEHVLRLDATLGGLALHCYPNTVTYHNFPISEDANMRAGIMNFQITVQY